MIALLRREGASWAAALATGFEASLCFQQQNRAKSIQLLRLAVTQFRQVDMRLFGLSAKHHLACLEGTDPAAIETEWASLGIAHPQRFADTFIPDSIIKDSPIKRTRRPK